MVIDFGADTVEISVRSLGGIVSSRLLKIGGNAMNEAICEAVKQKYNLLIGMKTAENLKLELGSALNTCLLYTSQCGYRHCGPDFYPCWRFG